MRDERPGPASGHPEDRGPGPVEGRTIYDGRIVHLRVERVRFPDGSTGELEIVRHPGAAAILPVVGRLDEPDPEVLLIRQYRHATGGHIYETPAGIPEAGESWEACARRELEEETGWRAGTLEPMTRVYTTPGFTDEVIHLFVASELTEGAADRDDDEFLEVVRVPSPGRSPWCGTVRSRTRRASRVSFSPARSSFLVEGPSPPREPGDRGDFSGGVETPNRVCSWRGGRCPMQRTPRTPEWRETAGLGWYGNCNSTGVKDPTDLRFCGIP